jgi:hypothetical protein
MSFTGCAKVTGTISLGLLTVLLVFLQIISWLTFGLGRPRDNLLYHRPRRRGHRPKGRCKPIPLPHPQTNRHNDRPLRHSVCNNPLPRLPLRFQAWISRLRRSCKCHPPPTSTRIPPRNRRMVERRILSHQGISSYICLEETRIQTPSSVKSALIVQEGAQACDAGTA